MVKFVLESLEALGCPGLFQSAEKIFNADGILWTDATTSYRYCGKGGTYGFVKPSLKTVKQDNETSEMPAKELYPTIRFKIHTPNPI